MAKVLKRAFPRWALMAIVLSLTVAIAAWFSLSKPLPEYLVAKALIPAGEKLDISQFELVSLDLGPISSSYLEADGLQADTQLADSLAPGELVPVSEIVLDIPKGQTSMLITPALDLSSAVVPGSWVTVLRSYELEEQLQTELLIPRAKVSRVVEPDGLFAQSLPQVELLIDLPQATILMESITAEQDIYLVPVP